MNKNLIDRMQELSKPISEMAMADLKGADLKSDAPETIASTYIRNARERGMDEKKIIASLGATFRGAGKEMPSDKIAGVKAEVKKQLGVESKPTKKASEKKVTGATLTKKAKEDETYQGTEKVKAAAKRASNVMEEERILELAGLNERKAYACDTKKKYSKDTDKKKDVYMSKETEFVCKHCGEEFNTEKSLEKHMRAEH